MSEPQGSAFRRAPEDVQMVRAPDAVLDLPDLRMPELQSIERQLATLCEKPSRVRGWQLAGELLAAAAIGSLVTGIPMLNSHSNWDRWVIPVYVAAIVIAAVAALLCFKAAKDIDDQRVASIDGALTDFRNLIQSYEVVERRKEEGN